MSAEWIKTAKVGDKVVCVDDRPLYRFGPCGLVAGNTYTIAKMREELGMSPDGVITYEVTVVLVEIEHPNPIGPPGESGSYGAFRFRPVQPRNTDISWAYEILRKVNKPVKETV